MASCDRSQKISVTGKIPIPKEELIAKIEDNGDVFIPFSRQQTCILLVMDKNIKDPKVQQAKESKIAIMTFDEYFAR